MGSHGHALAVSYFRRRARLRSRVHDFHCSIEKRLGELGRYVSFNEIHVLYWYLNRSTWLAVQDWIHFQPCCLSNQALPKAHPMSAFYLQNREWKAKRGTTNKKHHKSCLGKCLHFSLFAFFMPLTQISQQKMLILTQPRMRLRGLLLSLLWITQPNMRMGQK